MSYCVTNGQLESVPRPTLTPASSAARALSMMPEHTMSPFFFCVSVEWVFSGSSNTNGSAGLIVQVTLGARPSSCVPAAPRYSSRISDVNGAPCSIVSTPASSATFTPSVLSTWAMTGRPISCAALHAAAATSTGMRSTPGSPTSVASNTPPVTNSFMTSAPRAYKSRTCSAASAGLLATWANNPAP